MCELVTPIKLVTLAKLVNLVKLVKNGIAHLAECIPRPANMASVLPTMPEEKYWLPTGLLSLNLACALQCSDIFTKPFQNPVALRCKFDPDHSKLKDSQPN